MQPRGSITTWDDLVNKFLTKFFPPQKLAKLRHDSQAFAQKDGKLELENSGLLIEKLTLKSLLIDKTIKVRSKEKERKTSEISKRKNEERNLEDQETKNLEHSGQKAHA
ncbi:hypothetical protein PIB30_082623 [Stylosanthes scabra]|uniref:Retrotransposon gag domain-containing protein n=1 Tax=Stylosanthes scabra TaxID=79078 RepID=A0ABU6SSA2_9FABA|nr:hypothetical protein [Stylosanthes scabra]